MLLVMEGCGRRERREVRSSRTGRRRRMLVAVVLAAVVVVVVVVIVVVVELVMRACGRAGGRHLIGLTVRKVHASPRGRLVRLRAPVRMACE